MHIARRKYQLTLHSLSEIQSTVNNLSQIGMICLSQRAKLNSISLISRKLGDIPQIFLEVTTQKLNRSFLPQIISEISCPVL